MRCRPALLFPCQTLPLSQICTCYHVFVLVSPGEKLGVSPSLFMILRLTQPQRFSSIRGGLLWSKVE